MVKLLEGFRDFTPGFTDRFLIWTSRDLNEISPISDGAIYTDLFDFQIGFCELRGLLFDPGIGIQFGYTHRIQIPRGDVRIRRLLKPTRVTE